jgi:hypothetical protein
LVFADEQTLNDLRLDEKFRRPYIDLFVVFDEDRFEKPWTDDDGIEKKGSLSSWGWRISPEDETIAMYDARGKLVGIQAGISGIREFARKVWPRQS